MQPLGKHLLVEYLERPQAEDSSPGDRGDGTHVSAPRRSEKVRPKTAAVNSSGISVGEHTDYTSQQNTTSTGGKIQGDPDQASCTNRLKKS